ncbi:hypothetical protein ILUMI_26326 [Ignelater luminosus]|uniref:Uncharacterized protein n=1 Tax=Ignelater luminosus TaxID=2038154 RepID=A0A8K0C6Q0_IGNLU|nr:hypothetical protein ILUMI_26326 [Ignelater luminosus]
MVHLGIGGQYFMESSKAYSSLGNSNDVSIEAKRILMMQKRDIILTAVFASLAALILIAGVGAACYFYHKKRRKREDEDEDDFADGAPKVEAGREKKSRLNGFLSLKTPLISTKTLG